MSALTGALAGFTPWTPQEDETLRRVYPMGLAMLHAITAAACVVNASRRRR